MLKLNEHVASLARWREETGLERGLLGHQLHDLFLRRRNSIWWFLHYRQGGADNYAATDASKWREVVEPGVVVSLPAEPYRHSLARQRDLREAEAKVGGKRERAYTDARARRND